MFIPFAGRIAREVSREILEGIGVSEQNATRLSWVLGAAVTVATLDVVSAGHGVADMADALGSASDVADAGTSVTDAGTSAGPVHFGGTVDFPDGTQVQDPHQDALGYVYKSHDDYVSGVHKHVLGQ